MGHTYTKKSACHLPAFEFNWTSCILWRPYLKDGQQGSGAGGTQSGAGRLGPSEQGAARRVRGAAGRSPGLPKGKLYRTKSSPTSCTDHCCSLPSMKSLALPSAALWFLGRASWKMNNVWAVMPGWCLGRPRTTG